MSDPAPALPQPTSFSKIQSNIQLAFDSTSLGEAKLCLQRYKYRIIDGWTGRLENADLKFGILFHSATERYDHARAKGLSYDEAVRLAVRWALAQTWDYELGRPWLSDHKSKNRLSLIRTLVWYFDQFQNDPLETVVLANGKPAVELSFQLDLLDFKSPTGEPVLLCGHLDRIAKQDGDDSKLFIVDKKTTGNQVSGDYFSQFHPDNQMSTYYTGGRIAYSAKIKGIIVDAVQVGVTFSRFQRGFVSRSDGELEEWLEDTKWWIKLIWQSALSDRWPKNDKNCRFCPYQQICNKAPSMRDEWLKASFVRAPWDPLAIRSI